jgi:hypothetical protein
MLFPYFLGLFIGAQLENFYERTNSNYYEYTEKIVKLESKVKEYECLFGKNN